MYAKKKDQTIGECTLKVKKQAARETVKGGWSCEWEADNGPVILLLEFCSATWVSSANPSRPKIL